MSSSTNVYTINIRQEGADGKVYWKPCGIAFLNGDDAGGIGPKSISLKLDLFPNVEIVAFPRRERSDIP